MSAARIATMPVAVPQPCGVTEDNAVTNFRELEPRWRMAETAWRFDAPPDSLVIHMRCLQERDHSIWKASRSETVPFPFVPDNSSWYGPGASQ